ncbi:hypothetical protein LCGC14_2082900, partial [marine sediment metagenome]
MQHVNPEGPPAKTRIVIFAVPYSPNLGDGIIAECLAAGLTTHNGHFARSSKGRMRDSEFRHVGSTPALVA